MTSYQVPVLDSDFSCPDPRQGCFPSFSSPPTHTHSCLATIFYPLATGPSHPATITVRRQPQPAIHTLSYTSYGLTNVSRLHRKCSPLVSYIYSFSRFVTAKLSGMKSNGHIHNINNFQPFCPSKQLLQLN